MSSLHQKLPNLPPKKSYLKAFLNLEKIHKVSLIISKGNPSDFIS